MGIYEVIIIDDEISRMIHSGASEQEMEAQARKSTSGIRTDGRLKVLSGETTIDEILRVTMDD